MGDLRGGGMGVVSVLCQSCVRKKFKALIVDGIKKR